LSILLITAISCAIGGSLVALGARRRVAKIGLEVDKARAAALQTERETPEEPNPFLLALGDALILPDGEEVWCPSACAFSEDAAVSQLLFGSEPNTAVYCLPSNRVPEGYGFELLLAKKLANLELGGVEPPFVLEAQGQRLERTRRVSVYAKSLGTEGYAPPSFGVRATIAEYKCPSGEWLIVVISGSEVHAFFGRPLLPGMFDIYPAAKRAESSAAPG
jgi:hypothetical protein